MDEMPEVQWFKDRLRELREAAGWTQQELAARAGMKVGGVRDLEQGVNKPSWASVLALGKALGVSCTAFLEPPAPRPPARPGRPPKPKAEAERAAAPPAPPPAEDLEAHGEAGLAATKGAKSKRRQSRRPKGK
jgi:transcriptional regulator with XRE-family HTH domain